MGVTLAMTLIGVGVGMAGKGRAAETGLGVAAEASGGADLSLRNEVEHALERGLSWLLARQGTNGAWGTNGDARVTAWVVSAIAGEPTGHIRTNAAPALARATGFLTNAVAADGRFDWGPEGKGTSAPVMTSLALLRRPQDAPWLQRARVYLLGILATNAPGEMDLVEWVNRLGALRSTDYLGSNGTSETAPSLDWPAVVRGLEAFQAGPDAPGLLECGGFVEVRRRAAGAGPVDSAGGPIMAQPTGRATAAGLLGLGYARIALEDARVRAGLDWLGRHFVVERNPGGGVEGHYEYLLLVTKALTALGVETLDLPGDRKVAWRREWALGLLNLQERDGSWVNAGARGGEREPCLTTAYAVLALDLIWRGL